MATADLSEVTCAASRTVRVLFAALTLSGCSFDVAPSGPADATGSLAEARPSPLSSDLGPEDWRRARNALAVALDPQGNGAAASWDNPESGARGTFTPLGGPFVKADIVCRKFAATLGGKHLGSAALTGTACRYSPDEWTIERGVKARHSG